ncbi:MAG: alpha/beta hydrolase [Steroidobacteraceae bacterium]
MSLLELPNGRRIGYEQHGKGPDIVWISGGGGSFKDWLAYQVPAFPNYRSTLFDNRGIGETTCDQPLPWTMADFARDAVDVIRAICDPPVIVIGLSMGSLICQQLAIDFPESIRLAIAMGTAPRADGWILDYMRAEIEFRKAGHSLTGMMGLCHYLAALYPSSALGDPAMYGKLRDQWTKWIDSGDNERSLIGQWDACCTFDHVEGLPTCPVPIHVVGFGEDVQAPAAYGRRVAELARNGVYHHLDGLGHCSLFGHAPDRVNALIKEIIRSAPATSAGGPTQP